MQLAFDIGSGEVQGDPPGRQLPLVSHAASGCVRHMQRSALYLARLRARPAAREATGGDAADRHVELHDVRGDTSEPSAG